MRTLKKGFKGECRLRVCGAFPEAVLNACAMQAVELWGMKSENEYTLSFYVYEKDYPFVKELATKCMCEIELVSSRGGSKSRRFAKAHVWLLISASVMLLLLGISTLFIWDIDVYGCEELTEGELLRALAECGVECGSYWPGISKELVRSEMLCRLPRLAWMTVNISGSRALVLVAERQEKPEIYVESQGADIVASATGIIENISVLNGKPLVEKGQSVVAGETLISGLMESLSRSPRCVRSQGEVEARTWYEQNAVCPTDMGEKQAEGRVRRRFALNFGEHRINLYLSGRKYVDECDKIVHNYILGMKGVFALPVSLTVESFVPYELQTSNGVDTGAMGSRMKKWLEESIRGEILGCSISAAENDGLTIVTMRASCKEDIALLQEYESIADAP